MCHNVSMQNLWRETISILQTGRLKFTDVARQAGISEKTIRNAVKGRNVPTAANMTLMQNAVKNLLQTVSDSDSHSNNHAHETALELQPARAEKI